MDNRWVETRLRASTSLLCIAVALSTDALAQLSAGDRATQAHRVVSFVEVDVVPMDSEHVFKGQTVLVEDERISVIAPASEVPVPSEALRIDGRSKYLMPSLTDVHPSSSSPHKTAIV